MNRSIPKDLDVKIIILRQKMLHFCNNLFNYIQADIIDPNYSLMLKKLQKTESYNLLKPIFEEFVQIVMDQSFMNISPIYRACLEILSECLKFDFNFARKSFESCVEIEKTFDQKISFMFRTLYSLKSGSWQERCVSMFLVRMDFNYYFGSK